MTFPMVAATTITYRNMLMLILCMHWKFYSSNRSSPLSLSRLVEVLLFLRQTSCQTENFLQQWYYGKLLILFIFERSKDSHGISAYKIWGMNNSVPNELLRVPHIIGFRTTLVCNDMSRDGLYETTIYWWINRVGVCEDYVFGWVIVNIVTGVQCCKDEAFASKYLTNGAIWHNFLTRYPRSVRIYLYSIES